MVRRSSWRDGRRPGHTAHSVLWMLPNATNTKNKNAKEIFSKKQGEFQSVDDYIADPLTVCDRETQTEGRLVDSTAQTAYNALLECISRYFEYLQPTGIADYPSPFQISSSALDEHTDPFSYAPKPSPSYFSPPPPPRQPWRQHEFTLPHLFPSSVG